MPARVESHVLDNGLGAAGAGQANKMTLCTTEPTTYTEANATYAIASATAGAGFTAPLVSAPAAGTPNGRAVTTAVVANAAIASNGLASWVAIIDTVNSRLLVVLDMTDQQLTAGNTWGMAAATIRLPNQ